MSKPYVLPRASMEPLQSRRHMDVTLAEGFLGGGNSAVHLEVTVIGAGGQDSAVFVEVRLPSGKVLIPTTRAWRRSSSPRCRRTRSSAQVKPGGGGGRIIGTQRLAFSAPAG